MALRTSLFGLALGAAFGGCLPQLPEQECYGNDNCLLGQVCRSGRCVLPASEDETPMDAGPAAQEGSPDVASADAGAVDAGSYEPDAGTPDAEPCRDECLDPSTLRTCAPSGPLEVACAWGCSTIGGPHCARLHPSGGAVVPDDLDENSGLVPITIAAVSFIDSDTGAITGLRAEGTGVVDGIGFVVRNRVGVFTFGKLTVASGASLFLRGDNAVALVSTSDVEIAGTVDARGDCIGTNAGPGGGRGGVAQAAGEGPGGGAGGTGVHDDSAGGSGGSYGGAGGSGGGGLSAPRPGIGARYGDAAISVLVGGSGGGGGGGVNGAAGGGGGGAVQLAANGTIRVSGPINAGGCGGTGNREDAGGGGGAGGTILVEGRTIDLRAGGVLAVNGGGGGGGDSGSTGGQAGLASEMRSPGGMPFDGGGAGGRGGARNALDGELGANEENGGGGGGGVGRIRLNTASGVVSVEAGAILSPGLDDAATTTTRGVVDVR